jgi:hypothetical protein
VIVSRQSDHSATSFRLPSSSPVTKFPVVHPLSVQPLTKCFSRNPFVLKTIHFDGGGVHPLLALPSTTAIRSTAYPYSLSPIPFPLSFHILAHSFSTFLHPRKVQLLSFQAIPHFGSKNTTAGGRGKKRGGNGGEQQAGLKSGPT